MRISARGRYALAALVELARQHENGKYQAVIGIAQRLGISKIYLEQVFSQLKKAGLLTSIKGAQGGHQLARMPRQITVWDVLSAMEGGLFDPAEPTVVDKAPEIDAALRLSAFDKIDAALKETMGGITLQDLLDESQRQRSQGLMYYI